MRILHKGSPGVSIPYPLGAMDQGFSSLEPHPALGRGSQQPIEDPGDTASPFLRAFCSEGSHRASPWWPARWEGPPLHAPGRRRQQAVCSFSPLPTERWGLAVRGNLASPGPSDEGDASEQTTDCPQPPCHLAPMNRITEGRLFAQSDQPPLATWFN